MKNVIKSLFIVLFSLLIISSDGYAKEKNINKEDIIFSGEWTLLSHTTELLSDNLDTIDSILIKGTIMKNTHLDTGYFEWVEPKSKINESNYVFDAVFKGSLFIEPINVKIDLSGYIKGIQETTSVTDKYSYKLNVDTLILSKGSSFNVKIVTDNNNIIYSWEIEDAKVATIGSTSGKVSAIKNGETKVICTIIDENNNITKLQTNVVVGFKDGIQYFNKTNVSLLLEKTFDFNMKNKISGSTYLWKSDNKKIATVKSNGLVTAKKKGTTAISCTVTTPSNEIIVVKTNVTVK